MKKTSCFLAAGIACLSIATSVHSQSLKAVAPLSGYACMILNLTNDQLRDNSVTVPVFNGPSASSGKAGVASALLIVKSPLHLQNGFAETLFPDGRTVWIPANMLRPYKSEGNPNAHCTPSMMSDGKPGFG